MYYDYHLHSKYSGDSEAPIREIINKTIELNLKGICFTDHNDYDYPYSEPAFELDFESYFNELSSIREDYRGIIDILIGVELGLQPHLLDRHIDILSQYPFDFVIGSSHLINHIDPYYPEFFKDRTEDEAYMQYFEYVLKNIETCKDALAYNVYGHIDYVVRYGPNKNKYYSYEKYQIIIDEILKALIKYNKGIELNTAGFKYGLGVSNPNKEIIRRYRELGGEIITIGSDAHKAEHLAYDFNKVADILHFAGFSYYTIYKNGKPEFIKI